MRHPAVAASLQPGRRAATSRSIPTSRTRWPWPAWRSSSSTRATATCGRSRWPQVDVKGKTRWSIPSHDDYPADAKDQVASAAAGLMGLKILEMVSDNQGDQQEYGVVDPDPKTLKVGATGVGKKVVMKDKDGKELLALVIGKEVPGRPGLRYVRKVGQDADLRRRGQDRQALARSSRTGSSRTCWRSTPST